MTRQSAHTDTHGPAFRCIWIFMVANTTALVCVATLAATGLGEPPSTFMWVRAIVLVAASPLLLRWAGRAGSGDEAAAGRLRTLSAILPITVVVDIVPGLAPTWYGALQAIGALALIPVAVITRRRQTAGVG